MVDRYNLKGQHIDEVVGGAVITHSKDFNLTREAVLGTSLKASTPGITMMQACGTSLQGGLGSAAKIATGEIEMRHRRRLRHDVGRADRRVEEAGASA